MRRYAPHNTTPQAWSVAASARANPRQRALSSLRALAGSLLSAAWPPAPTPPAKPRFALAPPLPPHDVHAAPLLRALRRRLGLAAPLSPQEAVALRMLTRADAPAPRVAPDPACALCGELRESDADAVDAAAEEPDSPRGWGLNGDVLWQVLAVGLFWLVYVALACIRWVARKRRRRARGALYMAARRELEDVLAVAPSYSDWVGSARVLDELEGRAMWKEGEDRAGGLARALCAECREVCVDSGNRRRALKAARDTLKRVEAVCDCDMLAKKLDELAVLYKQGDIKGLAFALRASLVRNLGGMCHPELHASSRVGTAQIVEDYVNVTAYLLAYVAHSETLPRMSSISEDLQRSLSGTRRRERAHGALSGDAGEVMPQVRIPDSRDENLLSVDDKLSFLNEARHAYGRSALMLSGGASMGLNHLGVVKALLNQGLLPKVVCGTSAGALVASIVGIFDDEELLNILSTDALINPITNQPFSFRYFDDHTTTAQRFRRFIRKGYIQDVKMLQDCLRKNYGDLTFEEAYNKTRRILNITVCPQRSSSHPPLLLNYLTAPHVLIWSAASASCALPLVFAPVELVTKTANGRLVPYHPDGIRWIDGSISSDIPLARIGELFNVNHFIVSQTNAHVIPRSMPIMQTRIALLIKSELQFRYWQALQMGLVPKLLTSIFPHFMQPYAGDVTIMPDIRLSDLTRLLRNPTLESVAEFIRRGEIQTFPFMDRIRLHCLIEQMLDVSVEYVATAAKGAETPSHPSSPRRGKVFFGRVPSWLWLDTRSILGSSAMTAVTNRFGRARDDDSASESGEDRSDSGNEGGGEATAKKKRRRKEKEGGLGGVDEMLDDMLMELAAEEESGGDAAERNKRELQMLISDEIGDSTDEDERPMC